MSIQTTSDRAERVINRFFEMVNGKAPIMVNKANAPLIMIQLGEGQHLCLDETADGYPIWIETLKHYPATRIDPPETVEKYHTGYLWSEVDRAILTLIGLWIAENLDYTLWNLATEEDRGELS